jgi:UDP-N-acetylmuramate--alanine ligase
VVIRAPGDSGLPEATATALDPLPIPDPKGPRRFHYAGLGGSGMSALAQFQVMTGGRASGSERAFDRGQRAASRAQLERLGIVIYPQDGSGVDEDCAALVISTAVEQHVPDVARARDLDIPIIHRSELLAYYVARFRSIAVSGTSGKSTVVAMVFEILRAADRLPSVITGGELRLLQEVGLWGNAWYGESNLLVVEADESDGSLVRYHPAIGVVLNLQRDHKEMSEVARMFAVFRRQTREAFIIGDHENLAPFASEATVFGLGPDANTRATEVALEPDCSRFRVEGVEFTVAVPGRHNMENALAAIATCRAIGVPLEAMIAPLAAFHGVERRFQTLGRARGVEVVDDFAHNPAKLASAIETAQRRVRGRSAPPSGATGAPAGPGRVLAVSQPHGYGPTRFLRADFVETFATALAGDDRLWLLEIYYAGGTAQRDLSAAEIVTEIAARGTRAEFAPSREWLVRRLAEEAREGDIVLVMGARDPSLTDLARAILEAIGTSRMTAKEQRS